MITETRTPGWLGRLRGQKPQARIIEAPYQARASISSGDELDPILTLPRYFSPREAATLSGEYGEKTQLWLRIKQQIVLGVCVSMFIYALCLAIWLIGLAAFQVAVVIWLVGLFLYLAYMFARYGAISPDEFLIWAVGGLAVAILAGLGGVFLFRHFPYHVDARVAICAFPALLGAIAAPGAGAFYWAREIYDENLPYPPWVQAFMPALRAYARRLEMAGEQATEAGHHHILVNKSDTAIGYIPLLDFYEMLLAARKSDDPTLVPGRNLLREAFGGIPRLRDGTELGPSALAEWLDELARLGIISQPNQANRRHFIMPPAQAIQLLRGHPPTLPSSPPETSLQAGQAKSSQAVGGGARGDGGDEDTED